MGLLKAGIGAASGVLADQWREYFYCDSLSSDILMKKGEKRVGGRSSNTRGSDNIISNGSIIAVNEGQCMIITDQGKITEICADAGEFVYDSSTEPSVFYGGFGEGVKKSFEALGKRFTFGGDTAKDQRVYFFNTKEITDNKFGTQNPIPFRVTVDENLGYKLSVDLRCNGVYSYKITNPLLFYTNVCGNVEQAYERSEIDSQLKSEFVSALQPAFARLSTFEMRPNQIPAHTIELCDLMNETLTRKWSELRGISVVSIAMNSVSIPEEDAEKLKELQRAAALANPALAAGAVIGAQTDAMRTAAGNSSGAMAGFMGMGMAANAGGANAQALYGMAAAQQQAAAPAQAAPAQPSSAWTCSCGTTSTDNFCPECGKPRPTGAPRYRCDKCGWVPADQSQPPKFCPKCGDPFNDNDKV